MKADEFLRTPVKRLGGNYWGTIEPQWFNPDFLVLDEDQEKMSEDQEGAAELQAIVTGILEKKE